MNSSGIDPKTLGSGEGLARDFQQDSFEDWSRHRISRFHGYGLFKLQDNPVLDFTNMETRTLSQQKGAP
jgi:hypothetical protein